ncbi:hypothetical protein D9M69_609860 [compost metagenome]
MNLQARHRAEFTERIGETQQDEFAPGRGRDFRVVIADRQVQKRAAIGGFQTQQQRYAAHILPRNRIDGRPVLAFVGSLRSAAGIAQFQSGFGVHRHPGQTAEQQRQEQARGNVGHDACHCRNH